MPEEYVIGGGKCFIWFPLLERDGGGYRKKKIRAEAEESEKKY